MVALLLHLDSPDTRSRNLKFSRHPKRRDPSQIPSQQRPALGRRFHQPLPNPEVKTKPRSAFRSGVNLCLIATDHSRPAIQSSTRILRGLTFSDFGRVSVKTP